MSYEWKGEINFELLRCVIRLAGLNTDVGVAGSRDEEEVLNLESERRREERKNAERMLVRGIKVDFRKCSYYPDTGSTVVRTNVEDEEWFIGDVLGLQDFEEAVGYGGRAVVEDEEAVEEDVDVERLSDSENIELQGNAVIGDVDEVGVAVIGGNGEEEVDVAGGGGSSGRDQEEMVTEMVVGVVSDELLLDGVVCDQNAGEHAVGVGGKEKFEEVPVVAEGAEKEGGGEEGEEEREEEEEVTVDELLVTDEEFDNLFGRRKLSSDYEVEEIHPISNLMKDLYGEVLTDMEDEKNVDVVVKKVEVRVENIMKRLKKGNGGEMEHKFNMIEQSMREMCPSNEYTVEELELMKNSNVWSVSVVESKKEGKDVVTKRVKRRKSRRERSAMYNLRKCRRISYEEMLEIVGYSESE